MQPEMTPDLTSSVTRTPMRQLGSPECRFRESTCRYEKPQTNSGAIGAVIAVLYGTVVGTGFGLVLAHFFMPGCR
jgi:hypothetical protein